MPFKVFVLRHVIARAVPLLITLVAIVILVELRALESPLEAPVAQHALVLVRRRSSFDGMV